MGASGPSRTGLGPDYFFMGSEMEMGARGCPPASFIRAAAANSAMVEFLKYSSMFFRTDIQRV